MGLLRDYNDYFEALATNNTDIGHTADETHFVVKSFHQFDNSIRSVLNYPALVVEPPDIAVNGPNDDQVSWDLTGAIMVVSNISARKNTVSEQVDLADRTLSIINQILRRMRFDAIDDDHPLLRNFHIREADMVFIEQPDWLAWRTEFRIHYYKNEPIDNAKWSDIP